MFEPIDDFQYERRFFCHALPAEYRRDNPPELVIQSYYVHSGNYALRVRLTSHSINLTMDCDTYPIDVLHDCRDEFSHAYVTVKGPASLGTRYEKEMEIDIHIAAELVKRGGDTIIKNRYPVWIAEDGGRVRRNECAADRCPGSTQRPGDEPDDPEILPDRDHRPAEVQQRKPVGQSVQQVGRRIRGRAQRARPQLPADVRHEQNRRLVRPPLTRSRSTAAVSIRRPIVAGSSRASIARPYAKVGGAITAPPTDITPDPHACAIGA